MAYSPRRTIRQIVDRNPKCSGTLIASLAGIATVLGQITSSAAGDRLIVATSSDHCLYRRSASRGGLEQLVRATSSLGEQQVRRARLG